MVVNRQVRHFWGKAKKEGDEYHPLIFHSLDVAAVAHQWLLKSETILIKFATMGGCNGQIIVAWLLFFISLHDYGKMTTPFQLKRADLFRKISGRGVTSKGSSQKSFYHDAEGYSSFLTGFQEIYDRQDFEETWDPWLRAVMGHHGTLIESLREPSYIPGYSKKDQENDLESRIAWVRQVEELFLSPAGLSINKDTPPKVDPLFLAGFCSVSDWLGSNPDFFPYRSDQVGLSKYWSSIQQNAVDSLSSSGLLADPVKKSGFKDLFPHFKPTELQSYINNIPLKPGLYTVEAPTGAGKTELALQLAARFIASGHAESIIFALPTQATANAMHERLAAFTARVFASSPNIVLAHSKAKTHELLKNRINAAENDSAQTNDSLWQCSLWIAASRKRVFLGQIGVCTIDQVLLSALPIRHNYIRTFGLGKSVLIVDEVHSSDPFMIGLLKAVIRQQQQTTSPTILLSATLPTETKKSLFQAWDLGTNSDCIGPKDRYPQITTVQDGTVKQSPEVPVEARHHKSVKVTADYHEDILPSDSLANRIIEEAENGAHIGIVCNLVDDATHFYERIRTKIARDSSVVVELFHSRFTMADRHSIESRAISAFGRDKLLSRPKEGRILVATQVIEQSLDIDFDLLVTQIAPIDSIFQRIGRLHRFTDPRYFRPQQEAECIVLMNPKYRYGNHSYIYRCRRFLWRSQKLIEDNPNLNFPKVYRAFIESVYQKDPWLGEPEDIVDDYETFYVKQIEKESNARQLAESGIKLHDEDSPKGSSLKIATRDGEMSLSVLLLTEVQGEMTFIDGTTLSGAHESEIQEKVELMTIRVPASWSSHLKKIGSFLEQGSALHKTFRQSMWYVVGQSTEGIFTSASPTGDGLTYCKNLGLRKRIVK